MGLDDRLLTEEEIARARADYVPTMPRPDYEVAVRLAGEVAGAAHALNLAIRTAAKAGLSVDVDVQPCNEFGVVERPLIAVRASLPMASTPLYFDRMPTP